jgi:FAD:protein FMN transferase
MTEREVHSTRTSVMGTWSHVMVVNGDRELVQRATGRLAYLEQLWSRFLPDSDISRLNRAQHGATPVAPETVRLVQQAVQAWHITGGAFDPTLLPALEAAGYDRNFADLAPDDVSLTTRPHREGCGNISVNAHAQTIDLGPNNSFDGGGIAKGLAADLVASEMIAAGAAGALVNIGGDMRMIGTPPEGEFWAVEIDEPAAPGAPRLTIAMKEGAVATSTPTRRKWTKDGQHLHHLIDPITQKPIERCNQLVTCIATEAWWAEAMTKKLMKPFTHFADRDACSALVVDVDNAATYLGGFERYVISTEVAA